MVWAWEDEQRSNEKIGMGARCCFSKYLLVFERRACELCWIGSFRLGLVEMKKMNYYEAIMKKVAWCRRNPYFLEG